jgi:hypothetical protein
MTRRIFLAALAALPLAEQKRMTEEERIDWLINTPEGQEHLQECVRKLTIAGLI